MGKISPLLNILRNPYLHSPETKESARLKAADLIEELEVKAAELQDERDSLREAIELLQAEVVRTKSRLHDIKEGHENTINTARLAMSQSNEEKDNVLVMAGTLNRAREVAAAMEEPLLLINEAVPQLPAPTNEDEEEALEKITGSMARLARYAGMIKADGKRLEDPRITGALDEDRASKGLPLLSGPEDYFTKDLTAQLEELSPDPDWKVKRIRITNKPGDDEILNKAVQTTYA